MMPDPFDGSGGMDVLENRPSLLTFLGPVMAVCILMTQVVTFVLGILFSHRMAGPVFRMRRILQEMAEGELRGFSRLRRKDEFQPLMEDINRVKSRWRREIRIISGICREAEKGEDCRKCPHLRLILNRTEGYRWQ
jgi:nitrogen fixation/metabolism regulation signal transduction histidine kinase